MSDEVDRILHAWAAEAPGLDTQPLEILSRVGRLARLMDLERGAAFGRHGLEVWEFDVLAALRREGAPYELSPGDLIRQTLSTSGTMTNRVDRLVERGLVERDRNPSDRRGVRVRLTPAGADAVFAALTDLLEVERRVLSDLAPVERGMLASCLRTLLERFEHR